jgi:GT2 family glycosyltransferase
MNQNFVQRAGMALDMWRLLRYQTRLCRWFPLTIAPGGEDTTSQINSARWLGSIRIGRRGHHALFVPPGHRAVYRLVAPPGSRLVAWCGVSCEDWRNQTGIAFVATVRGDRASPEMTARLEVTAGRTARDCRWRKLVLDLQNRQPQEIELTLTIRMDANVSAGKPLAFWGEPRLEWPRPLGEIRPILQAAGRLVRRRRFMAAARTLHGHLSVQADPFRYQAWLRERTLSAVAIAELRRRSTALRYRPLVSVVTPVYNTDAGWLRACIESVRSQAYPNCELCLSDDGSIREETRAVLREYQGEPRIKIKMLPVNVGIAAASNQALTLADGEFVAFLDHDDELTPDALFEVVAHLNDRPDADFIYSDEDKLELDGTRSDVYFKPDWSPEHFLTNMYTCHLMVVRRSLLERIGGFRQGYEGAQDYDLVLRLMDHTTRIDHLPKVLYQWRRIPESTAGHEGAKPWAHDAGRVALEDYLRRNELNAEILPGAFPYVYRVRYRIEAEPLISIALPALPGDDDSGRDHRSACERMLGILVERTTYRRFEVLLPVAGAGAAGLTRQFPPNLSIREVPIEGGTIGGRLRQQRRAAAHARGDHVLFLDWGLKPLESDWLTALLEFSQQTAIGAVGAKLHYPDGSLRHVGILLGVNGLAAPALHRYRRSAAGYFGTAIAARNYSAVSGECLMTRRSVYEEVGGLDDEMGGLADVDYCLRVAGAGYRVVFTPHAALVHGSWSSPGRNVSPADAERFRMRWADRLVDDPYYNPNFSRDTPDYEPGVRRADREHTLAE